MSVEKKDNWFTFRDKTEGGVCFVPNKKPYATGENAEYLEKVIDAVTNWTLQEALELVGEDAQFTGSESQRVMEGYNAAKAELREALTNEIESL